MKALLSILLWGFLFAAWGKAAFAQAPRPACGNNSQYGVSGPPACCPMPGVNNFEPYTGNVQRAIRDLEIWGSVGELPMVWNRYYTSRGNILWNFSFVYAMYDGPVNSGQPTIVVDYPEGGQNTFTRNPANPAEWLPPAGIDRRVTQSGNDFLLQMADGSKYRFTKFSIIIGPNTYFYYLLQDIKDSKQNLYRLTYTVNRQLDSVIEPAGRFFKIHYTIIGGRRLMGQVTTSDGRSVQYSYDIYYDGLSKWIRFLKATYGDGTEATYAYVQPSPGVPLRLGHAIDPRFMGAAVNIIYTYEWSLAGGYIKEEKNGVSGQVMATLYATDSTRIVCYANGKQEVFFMPAAMLGNRAGYTDGLGRASKYSHDQGGQGFRKTDTDALNRVKTYTRTIYGNPLTIKYPDGSQEQWTRDDLDLALSYTDEAGRLTTYTRDMQHRLTRIDYPDGGFETFTYNGFGQMLDHRQRNGGTAHHVYDGRGLKTAFTDALGQTITFSYDGSDRLDSVTDARGNTTSYRYNERGLMTGRTHPDLSFQSFTYDAFGNRTVITDELGHNWTTTYDEFRRPVNRTDPLSRITQYHYDLPGGVCGCAHENFTPTGITMPSGKRTSLAYDVEWQKTSQTNGANTPDSATTAFEYDGVGKRVKTIDPKGNEWKTEYDLRNRKTAEIDPLNHRTEWTYDATGNILTVKRPDNGTTTNVYDQMSRITQSTDPKGQVSQFTYDVAGNMLTLTDPKGNSYSFLYDLLDRRIRTTYPGGTFEQYGYDPAGNLDSFTNRSGIVRTHTYDSRDREIHSEWSDATPDVSRTYDAASRMMTASSSVSALGYAYNNADELTSETQHIAASGAGPRTVSYTYNADGLRNSMNYPGGGAVSYGYTGRNQLDSIIDGAGPALVNYAYDLNGNRTGKKLANGTEADYVYDADDELLTVNHRLGAVSLTRFDYGYDHVHRRTFMQRDLNKGDVYSYDAVDQVTGVLYDATNPGGLPSGAARTVNYALDAAGNRTSVTDNSVATSYTSNGLNQYSSVGGNAISYNSKGDLTAQSGWSYTYDALGRLTSATNGATTASFAYDPMQRCVQRTVNSVPVFRYYAYWDLIEERNSGNIAVGRYVHGDMFDELIIRNAGGSTMYYHHDALGNVVRLTDPAGLTGESYTYDVFGATTIKNGSGAIIPGSALGNRFLFTGREFIQELGLYDYRTRFYLPEFGRFLQVDPVRFDAGDLNLYRYVTNQPVSRVDPLGLKDLSIDVVPALGEGGKAMKGKKGNKDKVPGGGTDGAIWWSHWYSNNLSSADTKLTVESVEDMVSQLKNQTCEGDCIKRMVVRAHGSSGVVWLGDGKKGTDALANNIVADRKEYKKEIADLLKSIKFCDNAEIIFWSCETGKDKDFLQAVADLTGATVWGMDVWTHRKMIGQGNWIKATPAKK